MGLMNEGKKGNKKGRKEGIRTRGTMDEWKYRKEAGRKDTHSGFLEGVLSFLDGRILCYPKNVDKQNICLDLEKLNPVTGSSGNPGRKHSRLTVMFNWTP